MTSTTTVQTAQEKMLSAHGKDVAEYPVKVGADKAQVSKRLNILERDMIGIGLRMRQESESSDHDYDVVTLLSVTPWDEDPKSYDFDHFVIPTAYSRKWTRTPDELLAHIDLQRQIAQAEHLPDIMRSGEDRELTDRLSEADRRGIKVPEGYVPTAE